MREDMTKLRRSIAEGAEDSENEAVRAKHFHIYIYIYSHIDININR